MLLAGLLLLVGMAAFLVTPPPPAFAGQPLAIRQSFAAQSSSAGAPTPEDTERAREHARESRWLFLASFVYEALLVVGFLLAGGTRWLGRVTASVGTRWVVALAIVFGILTLAGMLLTFPLDYYAGFLFEHRWGLSNQTTPQWLRDYAVGEGLSLLIGFPLAWLLYFVLRRAPRTWWVWMAAASVPISIFLLLIQPVFIAPLFNRYTELKDVALRADILALAHRQGIAADHVYEVDASRQSKAVNAYVNGVGPTQRIVLYDTLVQDFTHDEILFVMAHEMGHYVLGHIYWGIAFSVFGTLLGGLAIYQLSRRILARYGAFLGFGALGNPISYPLLMALGMLLSAVALPVGNAFSRQLEWQADRYAVRVYGHPEAGISAFHKLAKINIGEEDPPRWVEILLHSHPSIARRIAALRAVKQRQGSTE